ncbi:MAG: hypothetical protein HYR56_02215 [Acidobacteria bacterium]|nr:hypothetical protein [Acidobacteriota bacterium]MBI3421325.1 hypothetical protein [Acidobacteriota bacterium]
MSLKILQVIIRTAGWFLKYKKGLCIVSLTMLAAHYAYDACYCNGNLLFPYKLASASPNGIYKIEIKEAAKWSDEHYIFDDYKVVLRWEKNRVTKLSYCDNAIIGSSGTGKYDGSVQHSDPFSVKCSPPEWIAENVLGGATKNRPDKRDSYVLNQTDQVVNYLRVGWGCDYIILDLQPGAKVTLPDVSLEGALCAGRFFNKEVIACPGHPLGALPPYCLIIKPDKVVFECRQPREIQTY